MCAEVEGYNQCTNLLQYSDWKLGYFRPESGVDLCFENERYHDGEFFSVVDSKTASFHEQSKPPTAG